LDVLGDNERGRADWQMERCIAQNACGCGRMVVRTPFGDAVKHLWSQQINFNSTTCTAREARAEILHCPLLQAVASIGFR
jgi:hypothetical protein